MALPSFYIENVSVPYTDTTMVRGNTVSDLRADGSIKAFNIKDCNKVRAKNNKALRIFSDSNSSIGFNVQNCNDALFVYTTVSRCRSGLRFQTINTLNVYNITTHACSTHIYTSSTGTFRNVAMSAYKGHYTYKNCTGFSIEVGSSANVDYMYYYNISTVSSGTFNDGDTVSEKEILYLDEPNDDLTPDHISELVNSGTSNPLRTENPDIGGIESGITTEPTADRKYQYELLDNSFWDIDNQKSVEMSFIKAYQSRILANCDLEEYRAERDVYVKTAESPLRFSEVYPMYSRYANDSKFKKRVADMWFAGQNAATLSAYNNAIGGYNLFPSFFKRFDDEEGWVVGVSYVNEDNWLIGMAEQQYGIVVDVLGTSTLSQGASAECYNNTQKSVSDVAPVYWDLHDEPQPANYLLFTDLYNNFENCTLDNMVYNDDYNIEIDIVQQDGKLTTPLIPTVTVAASGQEAELSVLDRINSEIIERTVYYRQGSSASSMGAWIEVTTPIGEIINLSSTYLQFKIEVENILRKFDYEFMGLCLRPYETTRIWTTDTVLETYFELQPGYACGDISSPPVETTNAIEFPNDGVGHGCGWCVFVPEEFRALTSQKVKLLFATRNLGTAGTARFNMQFNGVTEEPHTIVGTLTQTYTIQIEVGRITELEIDVSSVIGSTGALLAILANRDSSDPLDTLAEDLLYLGGWSL